MSLNSFGYTGEKNAMYGPYFGTVIENLFASDLAFLQDLYRRINQDGHTEVAVTCPHCNQEFAVDIAGDAPGGS